LESVSYVLQFDMHFICTPMWTKKFILVKSGCYNYHHPEVATQAGGEVGDGAMVDLCTAYFMRETQIIGQGIVQSSWNLRRK
jgi:hypothetical protein